MGVGGTEYMILILSYYLQSSLDKFKVTIYAPNKGTFDKNINFKKVENIFEAIDNAKMDNEVFIFRVPFRKKEVYDYIEKKELKSIAWSHNYEDVETLNYIADNNFIKAHVCVGREQFDRLIDHRIIDKTVYIYNSINFNIYKHKLKKDKTKRICFVGAIDEIKGFHEVARIFNILETEFEGIELYVIGGDLYKTQSHGKYGISTEEYEKKFIKFITDSEGKIKKNVKFWGVKGEKEKLEIMSSCDVAIVNPTGQSETFCLVALEFQAIGIPVVSIRKYGLVDVVEEEKYGFLVKNSSEIIKATRNILNKKINYCSKEKYYNKNFDITFTIKYWERLFINVIEDKSVKFNNNIVFKNTNLDYKWIRLINYKIKKIFRLKTPSVIEYRSQLSKIKKYLKKD